jgi:RimJ/RimL family protein N-acetyltransferase
MDDGFGRLGFDEIVAFTIPASQRSWRVMERLGMTRDPNDDFDHPQFPKGHPLRAHVLYRLRRRLHDGSENVGRTTTAQTAPRCEGPLRPRDQAFV